MASTVSKVGGFAKNVNLLTIGSCKSCTKNSVRGSGNVETDYNINLVLSKNLLTKARPVKLKLSRLKFAIKRGSHTCTHYLTNPGAQNRHCSLVLTRGLSGYHYVPSAYLTSGCVASKRHFSQQRLQPETNPYALVQEDLRTVFHNIRKELGSENKEISRMACYHFDGEGKAFRPMLAILVARACNMHQSSHSFLSSSQQQIALITEMIHTASLVHDDVIDASSTRRGKPSVHSEWGQRKAILTGDFILSASSQMLARIRNDEVVSVLSRVLEDLVRGEFMQLGSKEDETERFQHEYYEYVCVSGEFMQLGSKEDETERFQHYLRKTYKKTASLMANSSKAMAILGECNESVVEAAFQFGKNIGVAFQLVDDLLDFTSCDQVLGKPTAADLKLGLATAPVLFAAQQYPELQALIMRRFGEPGDVEHARHLVAKSDGVAQTGHLVDVHSKEAIRLIQELRPSAERTALVTLTDIVRNREK